MNACSSLKRFTSPAAKRQPITCRRSAGAPSGSGQLAHFCRCPCDSELVTLKSRQFSRSIIPLRHSYESSISRRQIGKRIRVDVEEYGSKHDQTMAANEGIHLSAMGGVLSLWSDIQYQLSTLVSAPALIPIPTFCGKLDDGSGSGLAGKQSAAPHTWKAGPSSRFK